MAVRDSDSTSLCSKDLPGSADSQTNPNNPHLYIFLWGGGGPPPFSAKRARLGPPAFLREAGGANHSLSRGSPVVAHVDGGANLKAARNWRWPQSPSLTPMFSTFNLSPLFRLDGWFKRKPKADQQLWESLILRQARSFPGSFFAEYGQTPRGLSSFSTER